MKLFSALALVRRRDSARARALADKSEKAQASDTLLKVYWLPTTGAAVELNARHPAQAIIDLEATARYELGQPRNCNWGSFTPYFSAARLSSWLVTGKQAAAIEFQKFLLLNYPRLRLPILAWLAGMGSSEIAKKLAQNTRISFPHRKMAIPTSPYSRKPRRNTPNCSWAATSSAAFV